jgi:hypothetical protein
MLTYSVNSAVIGKSGVKINEIRTQSQCVIRVTDPGTPAMPGGPVNMHERLITIQGNPVNINIAVGLLHAVSNGRPRQETCLRIPLIAFACFLQRLEAEKAKKGGMMPGMGGSY